MFLNAVRIFVLSIILSTFSTANATVTKIEGNSSDMSNCIPFGGWSSANSSTPYMGFIYKNIPAFSLAVGDTIAFDLGAENDQAIVMDIALAATTSNGGTEQDSNGFTQVVNTGTPSDPNGNTTIGDFELEYTATAAFSFSGGGLIIRFRKAGSFANDTTCDQVLVHYDATDSSGYFVTRFYNRLYRTLVESGVSAKVTPISKKPTYHNFFYIEPKPYPEITDQWTEPSPIFIFKGRGLGRFCANNSEA